MNLNLIFFFLLTSLFFLKCETPFTSLVCDQTEKGLCREATINKKLIYQFESTCREGTFIPHSVCTRWNSTLAECIYRDPNFDFKQSLIFDSSHFQSADAEKICTAFKGKIIFYRQFENE